MITPAMVSRLLGPARAAAADLSSGALRPCLIASSTSTRFAALHGQRRPLQHSAAAPTGPVPDFAFAFDIDGVLLRSSDPLPRAHEALAYLQAQRIPFILLTNGGGKHESERVADLSSRLGVPLDTSMFVQSHTPFEAMEQYKDKTVLVVGGDGDKCRQVAEKYGFRSVVTPGDILVSDPSIWPFSKQLLEHYKSISRPLPHPPTAPGAAPGASNLKFDAIFVYNDPRDWGLDVTVIVDLLLSHQGYLGTLSSKNDVSSLPNKGYQQDGQPALYFSNPDLWWAAKYHLPRLGQGGFREALEGIWAAVTGGEPQGVKLQKEVIGKPFHATYEFAERKLSTHRDALFAGHTPGRLRTVYMVGDNPESDIRGANSFDSPTGVKWKSCLVQTGVYSGGEPRWKPDVVVNGVYDAVQWALAQSKWHSSAQSKP